MLGLSNDVSFARFEGIVPASELLLRSNKTFNAIKLPSIDGISPNRLLLLKSKLNHFQQFPSSFGMFPVNLFSDKSSSSS